MNHKILCLLKLNLLLLCVACVQVSDPSTGSTAAPVQEGSASAPNQALSAQLIEGDAENNFKVQLELPPGLFVLRRMNPADKTDVVETEVQSSYLDTNVASNATYQYQIGQRKGGDFKALQSTQITIPFDLTVGQNMNISADLLPHLGHIRNLRMAKDAQLIMNGMDVDLEIENLESDGGVITTWQLGPNWYIGVGPRSASGGNVQFHVQRGSGSVYIAMLGRDGEHGTSSDCNGTGNPGGNGGNVGQLHMRVPASIQVTVHAYAGTGGQGGDLFSDGSRLYARTADGKGGDWGQICLWHEDLGKEICQSGHDYQPAALVNH